MSFKWFKWEYNDGKFRFGGNVKFFNGFNAVKLVQMKAFKTAFTLVYPGKNMPLADIAKISAEELTMEKDSMTLEGFQLEEMKKTFRKILKKYAKDRDLTYGFYMNSRQMAKRTATYDMLFVDKPALNDYYEHKISREEVLNHFTQHADDPALKALLLDAGVKGFRLEQAENHWLPVMRIIY